MTRHTDLSGRRGFFRHGHERWGMAEEASAWVATRMTPQRARTFIETVISDPFTHGVRLTYLKCRDNPNPGFWAIPPDTDAFRASRRTLPVPCSAPIVIEPPVGEDAKEAEHIVNALRERLLGGWTHLPDVATVLLEIAQQLGSTALAAERISLVTVPVFAAHDGVQHVWERSQPDRVRTLVRPAGFLDDAEHLASPLHAVLQSGGRLRARLELAEGVDRFEFLAELAASGFTDYLAVPLPARRAPMHVFSLASRNPGGWTDDSLRLLDRLLSTLGMLLDVLECDRLIETAATDPLTGVASRRAYEVALRQCWSTCERAGVPISLLCIDIDYFKLFNDAYGHLAGDRCLVRVAAAVRSCARRGSDLVARLGGEEFVLLLPPADAQMARAVAEDVRRCIDGLAMPHIASPVAPHVSVSIGVATLKAVPDLPRNRLFELGDQALYRAKRGGRNRIEVS